MKTDTKSPEFQRLYLAALLQENERLERESRRYVAALISIIGFPIAVDLLFLHNHSPLRYFYTLLYDQSYAAGAQKIDADINPKFDAFLQQYVEHKQRIHGMYQLLSPLLSPYFPEWSEPEMLRILDVISADKSKEEFAVLAPSAQLMKKNMCDLITQAIHIARGTLTEIENCTSHTLVNLDEDTKMAHELMKIKTAQLGQGIKNNLLPNRVMQTISQWIYGANLIAIFLGDRLVVTPLADRALRLVWPQTVPTRLDIANCAKKELQKMQCVLETTKAKLIIKTKRNTTISRYLLFAAFLYALYALLNSKQLSSRVTAFIVYLLFSATKNLITDISNWNRERILKNEVKKRMAETIEALPWQNPKCDTIIGSFLSDSYIVITIPKRYRFNKKTVPRKLIKQAFEYSCTLFGMAVACATDDDLTICTNKSITSSEFKKFFNNYIERRFAITELQKQLRVLFLNILNIPYFHSFASDTIHLPVLIATCYADSALARIISKQLSNTTVRDLDNQRCEVVFSRNKSIAKKTLSEIRSVNLPFLGQFKMRQIC